MSLKRQRVDDEDYYEDDDDGSPFSVDEADDDDDDENVAEIAEFGHVRNLLPPSAKKPRLLSEDKTSGSSFWNTIRVTIFLVIRSDRFNERLRMYENQDSEYLQGLALV